MTIVQLDPLKLRTAIQEKHAGLITRGQTVEFVVALPGASAEEIETQTTKRVEEAVNTISGIDELLASSDQGSSRVTINFALEREIESAVQDVRDKVATVVALFPPDTRPPVIQKVDPDAQPILSVSAVAPRASRTAPGPA